MCGAPCPCEVDLTPEEDNESDTVVHVYVEVEREIEDGRFTIDKFPATMGYAHFLGEVIIYDLDGNDIARYNGVDIASIISWDVLEDGTKV